MGSALAGRLVGKYPLTVSDLNKTAVAALEKRGASVASSAADLARRCDVVVLCLPRSSVVRQVVFGPGGLAEGLGEGKLVIDQTSGVPSETRDIAARLAEYGVTMIDAPVAGGIPAAEEGTVLIMASGPDDIYEKALPVLRTISANVLRCGRHLGEAHAMKAINNTMNAVYRVGTLEIVALGRKKGLSLKLMTDVINNGSGRNRLSRMMLPAMIEGRASTNFGLALMLKDLDVAMSMAMECGAPTPVSNVVRGLFQIGVNTLGETAQLEDVIPFVEAMAATRFADDGESSESQGDADAIARLIDEALAACNRAITYECAALGVKYGLEIDDMAKVLNRGSAWSEACEKILPALRSRAVTTEATIGDTVESLVSACEMGSDCGAPMLVANTVRSLFEAGANRFERTVGVDELAHFYGAMAGIEFGAYEKEHRHEAVRG
jgi:3-hydroxyisobutyrate dehydrogenase